MAGYQWQVTVQDAEGRWVPDGNPCLSSGITAHCGDTAEVLAARLLRNWIAEALSDDRRWRATVWSWEPGRGRVGDPVAVAENAPLRAEGGR